ncbi:hypothetical protein [Sodalis-like endosymbiont of Proechinophthirus fluctus]|uniref:hypothetical protein n=1 Tax=Sodalis-like endosymbiont of Proechinophthirus fluctus TaxID=1462730 RepID=UPI000ACCE485|nr:hypothetical protein [Sodalis-like endosymbiont of Proechinophthirus fluctus]
MRSIAVLGILLMNITAFEIPKATYLNPACAGRITRGESWTWAVLNIGGAGEISHLVRALV